MEHVFNLKNLPNDFALFYFALGLNGPELQTPLSVEIKQVKPLILGSSEVKVFQDFMDCDTLEELFVFLHTTLANEWLDCLMPFTLIIESVLPWRDETDQSTLSAQERNPNLK
jgi:hypothetical protein